jgi:ribonuclease HI
MGYGVVIYDAENRRVFRKGGMVDAAAANTNNVAEYMALNAALDWLIEHSFEDRAIMVRGDSKLVIEQCFGNWRIKSGAYVAFAHDAKEKLARFTSIKGEWIRRNDNDEADELSKESLRDAGVEIVER